MLNGLVFDRTKVMDIVGIAVNDAVAEIGDKTFDRTGEMQELENQIDSLQARILELNKLRARREIDAEQYNTESREVMARIDALFAERDRVAEERNTATLSKAFQAVVADFLSKADSTAEFDRDIFATLVDKIIVKQREHITFILKDGSEQIAAVTKK